ncbi:MAG: tRNA uridine(34) 5-carboxymethylaminomethyl modification radical SAM/GNAT enzyme Elp3 [Candidatus Woesearchaeota archaeon]
MDQFVQACREIVEEIKKNNIKDLDRLNPIKNRVVKKYKLPDYPTNVDLIAVATKEEREKYKNILTLKPVRNISGVNVIAVMSKPARCPHGTCTYCPGGPKSFYGNVPQSYTGHEPSTMRAIRANYDSYYIVFGRLEQYIAINKLPQKIEVIVQGGTFPFFPKEYQEEFIGYIYKAMNDFSDYFFEEGELLVEKFNQFFELPGSIYDKDRVSRIREKIERIKGTLDFEAEKQRNESSLIKCVGLTIETKPDWGLLEHGNLMLHLGATRVELGVQSVYDDILKATHRGHGIKETIQSFQELRDICFKINAHYMPGLIEDREKDFEGMKQLFSDPNYRPDMLKIYPCMVMPGTALYQQWKKGKFNPITTEEAADMIARFKQFVPKYCRIMRVQRDIPTNVTAAGVDRTNLRHYVEEKLKKYGIKCNCIRCREPMGRKVNIDDVKILVEEYEASKGKEFFISAEDTKQNILVGFCRLRFPYKILRPEITEKSGLIRELHVYGEAVPLKKQGETQHRGFGTKLMQKAEEIAKDNGKNKMIVISGIGVRKYYEEQHGYNLEGLYMNKNI